MNKLTKQEAIDIYNKGEWKSWTDKQIVDFQLYEELLCMEFSVFHKAVGNMLGRPVFNHEFAHPETLIAEYEGRKAPATFDEHFAVMVKDLG